MLFFHPNLNIDFYIDYIKEAEFSHQMIENGVLKPTGAVQLKGGTYAVMSAENPLLARREIAVEIDTGKIKVGNGTDNYNDLPYAGGGMDVPVSDGNVYVMKNGSWVQATLVEQPSEWSPEIDGVNEIVLTMDEDMNVYQLTGRNVVVNA